MVFKTIDLQHFIKVSCHKEVAQSFSKNSQFQYNWLWWASTPVSLTDTLRNLRGAVELWQYLHVNLHEGRKFPLRSKRHSLGQTTGPSVYVYARDPRPYLRELATSTQIAFFRSYGKYFGKLKQLERKTNSWGEARMIFEDLWRVGISGMVGGTKRTWRGGVRRGAGVTRLCCFGVEVGSLRA